MLSYPGALPYFVSFKVQFTSSGVIGIAIVFLLMMTSGVSFLFEREFDLFINRSFAHFHEMAFYCTRFQ